MNQITTRRALEVILSRVRMSDHVADALTYALRDCIDRGEDVGELDCYGIRALVIEAKTVLRGVDHSFNKSSMLSRINQAKEILDRLERIDDNGIGKTNRGGTDFT